MVAARGRRVRRQEIAGAVWEDEDRDVRTLMWALRRALRDCNSGFDVPPDKGKEGNYLLTVAEPGTLEEAVDAFRFLQLTREAETRWQGGSELAAVEKLIAAARLWGGEPFGELWPDGPPESCRKLKTDLEHARDFLIRILAEAALRLEEGGWLVAAAANDEGGRRLAQDCALLGFEGESASKYHARTFWAKKSEAAFRTDVAEDWAARAALQFCEATGFYSHPGLFSWDRIDAGSQILAQHIAGKLSGAGADFGCGYGYLAREIVARNLGIKKLICLDADARAVTACALNMEGASAECRQADLTQAHAQEARFEGCDLSAAVLTGADLSGATLTGSDLTGIDPADVTLRGTIIDAHQAVVLAEASGMVVLPTA